MDDLERRFSDFGQGVELRMEGEGEARKIVGHAVPWNSLSAKIGEDYRTGKPVHERFERGAFSEFLRSSADVVALVNHDSNLVLGRRSAGTLRLREDDTGLAFEIDPPDTSTGRDIAESIARGDIKGNSFAFLVAGKDGEEFREEEERVVRTVKKARLRDICPVTFPCYRETKVAMRSLEAWRKGVEGWKEESRARRLRILEAVD